MHALSLEYIDNEWTRRRDGVDIPQTTSESIKRLCKGEKYMDWGGIRLSNCRCYYVTPAGQVVMKSTIRRVLGQADTEHRLLSTYLTIPNGQVKNFVNACRASRKVGETAYVAVVGSKASEGGGVWHRYFALWLAMRCKNVIIDFYDFNEVPGSWNVEIAGCRISCEWIQQGVTPTMINEMGYNVVVDDVWTYETGSGLQERINARFFSLKVQGEREGAEPFLHSQESRVFSDPLEKVSIPGCGCMLCTQLKGCSRTYDEYLYLRNMCSRLGHSAPCVGTSFIQELVHVHQLRSKLLTTGEYEITQNAEFRRIMSLTEELSIAIRGKFVRMKDVEPEYESVTRFHVRAGHFEPKRYAWLVGKSVLFCGVPASIVGETPVKAVKGPQSPDLCDVMFVNSVEAWKHQFAGKVVYAPVNPQVVSSQMPDWVFTGRKINHFNEYSREESRLVKQEMTKPAQYYRDKILPAQPIFPVMDSSYLGSPLVKFSRQWVQGQLYSLVKERWRVVVVPFMMKHWRTSIVVSMGQWTMVSLHVERLYDLVPDGDRLVFRQAACPLPWDMSDQEVLSLELRLYPLQQKLREAYWKRQKAEIPYRQREFALSHSEPSLIRLKGAHPVSLSGWAKEEWQKLRDNWAMYSEYEMLEKVQEL